MDAMEETSSVRSRPVKEHPKKGVFKNNMTKQDSLIRKKEKNVMRAIAIDGPASHILSVEVDLLLPFSGCLNGHGEFREQGFNFFRRTVSGLPPI